MNLNKIINNRWHLHILAGSLISIIVNLIFNWLNLFNDLNFLELLTLNLVLGTIIGFAFEIFQSVESGRNRLKFKFWYTYGLIAKTHKTKIDLWDAFFTGVGFSLGSLILLF